MRTTLLHRLSCAWRLPALVLLVLLLATAHAQAQAPEGLAAVRAVEAEIAAAARDAERADTPAERAKAMQRARDAHAKAIALQGTLGEPVAQIEQRIAQLGPDAAKSPDRDVRQQHQGLTRDLARAVALTQRAALAEVEAKQSLDGLAEAHARAIGEELFLRTASPLAPELWSRAARSLPRDLARARVSTPVLDATVPAHRTLAPWASASLVIVWAFASAGLAVLLRRPLRAVGMWIANRLGRRERRFAVALYAVLSVVVSTLLAAVSGLLLLLLVPWMGLSASWAATIGVLTVAAVFGVYVRALGVALLQPAQRAWRIWTVSDASAVDGVRAITALAIAMGAIVAVEALKARFALGVDSQIALYSGLAFFCVGTLALSLFALARMRGHEAELEAKESAPRHAGLTLWILAGWCATAALAVAGVLGYIGFANRISQWTTWGLVVLLTTWVLMVFVDGLCRLLGASQADSDSGTSHALKQVAVLLSAALRLLLLFLACGALLVPFGAGFTSVLELLANLASGVQVGGITISIGAVLRGVVVFAIVLALAKFVRAWITASYLPTTSLRTDARDSIDKILRYVGIVLAVLWALTAFGVGMEKVAILASALSVGIGFGLQAITQNFVSGLILLVERPVKIGDWVKLNDVEGDVRRINVRSTEIRVADHSTVIVPNSELITKIVTNKTKGSSLGRAQILLSIPLEAELEDAMRVVTETFAADEGVLEHPAPAVFIDKIDNGMAVLNAFAHVRTPRDAYGVRSRLILAVLRALKAHDIPVTLPPQQFVLAPAEPG